MSCEYTINSNHIVEYKIKYSQNIFDVNNRDLLYNTNITLSPKRLIVLDSNVNVLYRDKITQYFDHHKINYKIVLLNAGEFEKSVDNLLLLLDEMENFNINRKMEPIIAIGGGSILDIAGLAASLYRRGIPYIRVPTTLLGIVDVSVAAKTGINFKNRRNRLGSYYPPILSLLDKSFISSQNELEISSGMGEILKMAVIKNNELFELLEQHGNQLLVKKFDHPVADRVIDLSIQDMIVELENNLWEKNLKRLVDFGHSFSPIIEMRTVGTENELTHGQAVTLDVLFSCIISYQRNFLSLNDLNRIYTVIKQLKLPTYHEYFCNIAFLVEALNDTVKHRNGDQNLPMPIRIGEGVFINDLTKQEIQKAIELYEKSYSNNRC